MQPPATVALVMGWAKKDPIDRYERALVGRAAATPAELQDIFFRIERELDDELAAAEASPLPDAEDSISRVYADREVRKPTPTLVTEWKARR